MGKKLNPELDKNVETAMHRTIDAIGYDLQDLYEDGIIPKVDAREMVIDADRILMFGGMDEETTTYYKGMSRTHRDKLLKKAIPYDLC